LVFHSSNSVYYFKDDKNIFKHSITFEGKTNLLKYINDILITDENEIMIAYGTRICKWSPTLEVNNNLTPDNIISPNPAIDYISVSHSALDAESTIEIFNILGESVTTTPPIRHTFELEGEKIRIDISNLVPGVYFIRIDDKFEKFIKL
jgi:hypothetical protein